MTPTARDLRVAVLTTPETTHGLNRYAGVLADAYEANGARVDRHEVPTGHPLTALRAAWAARSADLTHLQFTDRYLGSSTRQLVTAAAVRLALLGRPVVVTAHDFHTPRPEVLQARRARGGGRRARVRRRLADTSSDASARLLLGSAAEVLTCSARESDLLAWTRPRRTAVVPHYVEEPLARPATQTPAETRLVVAGFIHRRKGQHLAVEALPLLPGHHLVLAGSATGRNGAYLQEITARARDLGVEDRLRITGFLSEADMTAELRSARLALAPYQRIAASGSIATLIGTGVPLVARASAYTEELARECPGAVHLVHSDDPADLAVAVKAALQVPLDEQRAELAGLTRRLSPRTVGARHLQVFRDLLTS